jgi:pilus assembly protein CpaE
MKSCIIYQSSECMTSITKVLAKLELEIIGQFNNYLYGYDVIKNHLPDCVFIQLDNLDDAQKLLIRQISMFEKNISLYGFCTEKDTLSKSEWAYYGIRSVLLLPNDEHRIEILLKDYINTWQSIKSTNGKVITVYSNKGGLGKTSISTNIAVALAQQGNSSVALIDLNLQLGDVATFLDLNPKYTISDISKNIERLDEDYIRSSFEKYNFPRQAPKHTVYVLADPISVEQCEEISAEHINTIITLCKNFFDFVVIDLSSSLDNKTITAIDLSDHVLLVTLANLPSIKSANRVLSLFKELGYKEDKIKVILNRYSKNDEITPEDIEDVLKKEIYFNIDNNYQLMCNSINKGEPVTGTESSATVAQCFHHLSRLLAAHLPKAGKNPGEDSAHPSHKKMGNPSLIGQMLKSLTKK